MLKKLSSAAEFMIILCGIITLSSTFHSTFGLLAIVFKNGEYIVDFDSPDRKMSANVALYLLDE